ncbi:cupin domain-containing protein [Kitasatospora sp. NBC_01250]|uniref:JmjC domain-containing protein n=1 Tax=unclassified Kitasatospora TaxID=2633591 RepID=UPI002E0E5ACA|nr:MULTISPECIES: cupin domain-containing protein [unclassified Kitasatospora]WSJ71271.1 cupin domain-containing protein [Kitasatospora sp. NBC_01302]
MGRVLTELVGDTEAFAKVLGERRPRVFRTAGWPAGLPRPSELDAVLRGGLLRVPYVEMVRAGEVVPPAEFCTARLVAGRREEGFADPDRIAALLAEGATLLLPQLDQWYAPVRALAADIAVELGRRTEAFCFATGAGRRGLDVHRDDADVLVVQLAGEKEWTVYEAPADGRWRPGPAPEPGAVAHNSVLRPGEVLYVPRGAPHAATGHQGLAVHLSFTIREAGTGQLRSAVGGWLARGGWAEGLPERPATPEELLATAAEVLRLGRARLAELTPEQLLRLARGPLPAAGGDGAAPGHGPLAAGD